VTVYTSQCNIASRKIKRIGFRTEEESSDVVSVPLHPEGCYT
jgi:hypothetical protein